MAPYKPMLFDQFVKPHLPLYLRRVKRLEVVVFTQLLLIIMLFFIKLSLQKELDKSNIQYQTITDEISYYEKEINRLRMKILEKSSFIAIGEEAEKRGFVTSEGREVIIK